jgi:hypothetical protein
MEGNRKQGVCRDFASAGRLQAGPNSGIGRVRVRLRLDTETDWGTSDGGAES